MSILGNINYRNSFSIPVLYLSWQCSASSYIGAYRDSSITFDTETYNILTIREVTLSPISNNSGTYNSAPSVIIKSGDTVVQSLASGNTNLLIDISEYNSISICIAGGTASGQITALYDVVFN